MVNERSVMLEIRIAPQDLKRIQAAASAHLLDPNAWAHQALLKAIARLELPQGQGQPEKRGNASPPSRSKGGTKGAQRRPSGEKKRKGSNNEGKTK